MDTQAWARSSALAMLASCALVRGDQPAPTDQVTTAQATATAPPQFSEAQLAALTRVPDDAPAPFEPEQGPYWVAIREDPGLPDFTLYEPRVRGTTRPAHMPLVVFGNGGCANDNRSARELLRTIASHGFLVIAVGPLEPRKPGMTRDAVLVQALDWARAENERAGSTLRGRIEAGNAALAGWSCGGLQALHGAGDARVRSLILLDSGAMQGDQASVMSAATKADLQALHSPVLYLIGGPVDVAHGNAQDDFDRIDKVPVMLANLNVGHTGTFRHAGGGWWAQVASQWLRWTLGKDARAGTWFQGRSCRLCNTPGWDVQRKRLGG